MFSEGLRQYAEEKFNACLPALAGLATEITERLQTCSPDEQLLMKFLYGTMPIRDAGEYDFQVFLGFVRHSLMVYQTMEWCRQIPEDMFLHHILYYRINSENIEDCRPFFYEQLMPRIQGMEQKQAVLEINYWCAQNGTYESSDRRTISPMTLYRSGKGRCGEESTFAVTAYRSVGIPARQVYTPRWAHCDDNHAWVEVYVDGAWHFLGACEPEEVLDKGWFTNASSRALLVHTRTFSDYSCSQTEQCLGQEDLLFYYNATPAYARTRELEIQVLNHWASPVAQAFVAVEILNSAEFCPVARLLTDGQGKARITLGLGHVHLTAGHGQAYAKALVDVRESSQVVLTLLEKPGEDVLQQWQDLDIMAPADFAMHPVVLTAKQKQENRNRLAEAGQMRTARIEQYYHPSLAKAYPKEQELLRLAAGNFDEIYRFLSKDQDPDRARLLHSLTVKDYKDAGAAILEHHLAAARPYRDVWEEKGQRDIYTKYILCPRIFYEELTAYRQEIQAFFTEEQKQAFIRDPRLIWSEIRQRITYDPGRDYQTICSTPVGCLKLMQGNPLSQRILFVAVCRTLGLPARINPVNQEAEVYQNGGFTVVSAELDQKEKELGTLVVTGEDVSHWNYYQTWSIGRWQDGLFVTLDYTDYKLESQGLNLLLEPGLYRLITSERLPNGNQLASLYSFYLEKGQKQEVCLRRREGDLEELLVCNQLEDFPLTVEGERIQASRLTQGQANILAFLAEGQEPTEHVLNEMRQQRDRLKDLAAKIWFVLASEQALSNHTLQKVLEEIPGIGLAYVDFNECVEPLARRMYVDPDKLPLLLVTDPGLTAIYGCSGYNVGSVDMMIKLLEISRKRNGND